MNGSLYGFNLHAGVRVPASDRSRLERLCRYAARGPFATERLTLTPEGDIVYRLRRRWRDGTTSLRFSPDELIEKLCALVPPPRFNLTRSHGVSAPNHRLRALVTPLPDENEKRPPEQLKLFRTDGRPARRKDGKPCAEPRPRMQWANLLKRTFGVDVLVCEKCGHSPLKLVAMATQPHDVRTLLRALGSSGYEVPPTRLPRGPPPPHSGQLQLFAGTTPSAD